MALVISGQLAGTCPCPASQDGLFEFRFVLRINGQVMRSPRSRNIKGLIIDSRQGHIGYGYNHIARGFALRSETGFHNAVPEMSGSTGKGFATFEQDIAASVKAFHLVTRTVGNFGLLERAHIAGYANSVAFG